MESYIANPIKRNILNRLPFTQGISSYPSTGDYQIHLKLIDINQLDL